MLAVSELYKDKGLHLLEYIVGNSHDLVYIKDTQSRFILANDIVAEYMGAGSAQDLIGKTDADYYSKELAEKYKYDEQLLIEKGEDILDIEEQCFLPNKEVRWLSTSKFLYKNEDGEVLGIIGVGRDITSRKEYKDEINKKSIEIAHQSGKIELANNVLHNVGNVLNSVNVSVTEMLSQFEKSKAHGLGKLAILFAEHSDNIEDFILNNPKGKIAIEYIIKIANEIRTEQNAMKEDLTEITRYVSTIRNILDIQQDYTRSYEVLSEVSLKEIIDSALRIQSRFIENRGIVPIVNVNEKYQIKCDKSKIIHVFINLIKNATEAMSETPVGEKIISIKTTEADNKVIVAVSDKGHGIEQDKLKRIFNHGFTTKPEGFGFGLHSCAISMLETGGRITAKSNGEGTGTTFELIFPIAGDN